jgi:hypothetical protein
VSNPLVLGVDGGASKTECAVVAPGGRQLVLARGGPSNHEIVGFDNAAENVSDVVWRALEEAKIKADGVAAACFAMAGMDLPPDRDSIHERIVAPLGLGCPTRICNDAFAAFRAGAPSGVGVCVSLGTGITFCGRNSRGREVQLERPRPVGIDQRITDALLAEYYGIGPACCFTDAYLKALGLEDLEHLLWSRYAHNRPYAPKVEPGLRQRAREILFQEPYRSDPGVCELLSRYGEEIADVLLKLAARLDLGGDAFDVVLSGSLLTKGRSPALNDTIIKRVQAVHFQCRLVIVDGPPVDGAVRIALELLEAGGSRK